MSFLRQRIQRLEAWRRRRVPLSHFLTIVRVPWGVEADTWLRDEVTCACGERGCPHLGVGLVVPEILSGTAWQERAEAYAAQRKAIDA